MDHEGTVHTGDPKQTSDVKMGVESPSGNSFLQQKTDLLRLTAIFDGEFSLDWLVELTGLKASLILSILEEAVEEKVLAGKEPAIYVFRDSRKREERLAELSEDEKERYHRNIAAVLIHELPDGDAKALAIAHHLLCVSNDWRGCQWLVKAGNIYFQSFSADNAIACFEKVLHDLSSQRGDSEDWLFVRAAIGHSNTSLSRSNAPSSIARLLDARERAKGLGNESTEVLLEMHIAKYERLGFQLQKALKRFEQALSRVEALNDPELTTATTTFSVYFLFWQGRFRDVIDIYEKSVPDVEKYPIGPFSIVAALMAGHSYTIVGRLTLGLGLLDTIRDYCLQKGDLFLAAYAGSVIAMAMLSIYRVEDAFRYLKTALKEARESHNISVELGSILLMALGHSIRGEKKEALDHLRRFLKAREEIPVHSLLPLFIAEICWAIETGQLPPVPGLSLDQEIDEMLAAGNIFIKGIGYRYEALLGKSRGWPNRKVFRSLTLSEKWLEDSGNRIELAKTKLELTRQYLATGNEKKGRRILREASDLLASTNVHIIPDDLRPLIEDQNHAETILDEILGLAPEMISGLDNSKLLQQIVATANRLTGAERGALLILEEGSDPPKFHLRASRNLTTEQINLQGFVAARQFMENVAISRKGRIFAAGSLEGSDTFPEGGIRSSICVPLITDDKVIGILYHDNRLLLNVFKDSDLMLLSYFGALAAIELDREKAHRQILHLKQSRRQQESIQETKDSRTDHFDGIIGTGRGIQRLLAQVEQVAGGDTAVLILGETGVGKNLVAGTIHRKSLRCNGPLITVQCSALTESLITSELFGHEKGAFTGATDRRIGRFELADKGTLFLDEIGDLSLEVQARLLRVLQSKEFERVGGGKDILISDFRLIAATNRDLEQEIKEKRFREDLYYRINVFPIYVPPLRDRKEDIPLLANHFLRTHAEKQGKQFNRISQEVLGELVRYEWPGNIRELENVIERGVISSRGPFFQLPGLQVAQSGETRSTTFPSIQENERQHILEALRRSGWKIHGPGGAAEILEINPFTLTTRMRKLGIKKPLRNPSKQ
jgi:formate hydrogenlyase transcriptional activator